MVATPLTCVFYPGDWDTIPKDGHMPVPGSMFFINFSSGHCSEHEPPCERHLAVICPDGHLWNIDSRASNCTVPCETCGALYSAHTHTSACKTYTRRDSHHCWVRHGEPPLITVDKNGVTCAAGGGSIQTPDWHGYLRNGVLDK